MKLMCSEVFQGAYGLGVLPGLGEFFCVVHDYSLLSVGESRLARSGVVGPPRVVPRVGERLVEELFPFPFGKLPKALRSLRRLVRRLVSSAFVAAGWAGSRSCWSCVLRLDATNNEPIITSFVVGMMSHFSHSLTRFRISLELRFCGQFLRSFLTPHELFGAPYRWPNRLARR